MARAYGSSAHLLLKRETTYGQAATGDYIRTPFNRCNLGSEQGLIDDPVLGQGRDALAPLQDVITDEATSSYRSTGGIWAFGSPASSAIPTRPTTSTAVGTMSSPQVDLSAPLGSVLPEKGAPPRPPSGAGAGFEAGQSPPARPTTHQPPAWPVRSPGDPCAPAPGLISPHCGSPPPTSSAPERSRSAWSMPPRWKSARRTLCAIASCRMSSRRDARVPMSRPCHPLRLGKRL